MLSLAPFLLLFFNFFSSSLVGAEDMGSTEELFLGMVTKLIGFLKREKRELTCIRDSLEVLFDQEDNSEAVGRHISAIQSASTHRDALNYISKHIHDKETRANFRELFFSSDTFFSFFPLKNKTNNRQQETWSKRPFGMTQTPSMRCLGCPPVWIKFGNAWRPLSKST